MRPNYLRVWLTFFRNSLVREMAFRGNFLITVVTQAFWFAAQVVLFEIIYSNVRSINDWSREEYFAFMATGMLINAVVQAFFMPNCAHFSELIRKGDLDFALLKPIDTQFLISFEKVEIAMLNQVLLAGGLLGYALTRPSMSAQVAEIGPVDVAMYVLLLAIGVAFFYSLMIALASTSIWFGRNQGLYDFWFYVTVFARYPRDIYRGSTAGEALYSVFSYVLPILLVVTVPSRVLLQKTLEPNWVTLVLVASSLAGLVISRGIFHWSLRHYRSASS
ncbi:MAG: ABC-2 family transporter protein [Planctomycetaceae bacterium]